MISETIRELHARDLKAIEEALLPVDKIKTKIFEPTEEIPFHSLLVYFGDDEKGRQRFLNLIFLSLEGGDFDSVKMLQYYIELPFDIAEGKQEAVRSLMTQLNLSNPFGHFGIKGEKTPIWRYVQVLPVEMEIDMGTVHEVVSFISYMLDTNMAAIEAAAQ